MKTFTLEFWEEDGWYIGRLIEIPGVFSQGETLDELRANIRDAYDMMIENQPSDFIPKNAKKMPLEITS